jgi:hypothetical protein
MTRRSRLKKFEGSVKKARLSRFVLSPKQFKAFQMAWKDTSPADRKAYLKSVGAETLLGAGALAGLVLTSYFPPALLTVLPIIQPVRELSDDVKHEPLVKNYKRNLRRVT